MAYTQTLQGTQGYLGKALKTLLPDLNAELIRKVPSAGDAFAFIYIDGEPVNVKTATLAVYAESGMNDDLASLQDQEQVNMVICILLPQLGNNKPATFEMGKQVALDMVKSEMSKAARLAPKIDFASDGGTYRAIRARWYNWADAGSVRMADNVTYARRYELRWWAKYQIINA